MKKIGFDNQKYLEMQSKRIKERISQFGDKLYLEFGGKLFDDYHASRVLPGFAPDSKLQMLLQIKEDAEIVFAINASHINSNKIRQDLNISYQEDVIRLINEFTRIGLYVSSVVITQYAPSKLITQFQNKLKKINIRVYHHYTIEGYPTDSKKIISKEGFGRNDFIETTRPLVVVTAPGPGSGKMATCLSQLYHEHLRGTRAGYAKYETFPIWNLPLDHPSNLAYEAATADLNDVNMIDPYHLNAYGKITVNYNRDIEIFPVLKNIFEEIYGSCPYASPTDMGVNMIGSAIVDDHVIQEAGKQEIIRRYYDSFNRYCNEICDINELNKQKLIMGKAHIDLEDRKCVKKAHDAEKHYKVYSGAIDCLDGTIVTGRTTDLMGACSSVLINTLKYLAHIDQDVHIIQTELIEPIQSLKTEYLGSQNPRLHANEILIALCISAQQNENARKALSCLNQLQGLQAHITCDLSTVDLNTYSQLGIQVTYESNRK
ncbi:DUF1846 domain-containing protein [Floccifex sp.]|uniref:DUF1846 domain-containing protein n=1 Tax=Floccifex sp. TaxID=2815810 RepID=UPI003F0596F5